MKTEIERYKEAVRVALVGFNEIAGTAEAGYSVLGKGEAYAKDIEAIINPPVEMESMTIERWSWGGCCNTYATEKQARAAALNTDTVIKLTGTLTRPKPVPVERSVSVQAYVTPDGEVKRATKDGYVNYPTFKNCEESYHKTGVLTFTWTE